MTTLHRVLTVAEVARLAGWSYDRMLAHLLALNTQTGGMLLRNVSRGAKRPRWTITLEALQSISPEWFVDRATIEAQLHTHDERLERLEHIADLHAAVLAKRVA